MEPNSQRSRGFGFVVFSNAEDAENVFLDKDHEINGKTVEVKRAISKDVRTIRLLFDCVAPGVWKNSRIFSKNGSLHQKFECVCLDPIS